MHKTLPKMVKKEESSREISVNINQTDKPKNLSLRCMAHLLKPSLSMKILFINNFTSKLLSKLLSDLYIGVHLKGTKKFGSKVINGHYFHRKTVFHMKILSIINFTTKLLSIKDYFSNGPQ